MYKIMLPDNCLGRVQISKVSQVNILLIQHGAGTCWPPGREFSTVLLH